MTAKRLTAERLEEIRIAVEDSSDGSVYVPLGSQDRFTELTVAELAELVAGYRPTVEKEQL